MKIYTRENLTGLVLDPTNPWEVQIKERIVPLIQAGCAQYIPNVNAQMGVVEIDDLKLPFSLNDDPRTSYVANPLNYLEYGHDEIDIEISNRVANSSLHRFLNLLWIPFKRANFHRVLILNNWLLSTNLYELSLTPAQLEKLTAYFTTCYPDYVLMWRSLNAIHHSHLLPAYQKLGYAFVPSRQIYLLDPHKTAQRLPTNLKKDYRLLRRTKFQLLKDPPPRYAKAIAEVYRQLYNEKYSRHNPQYKTAYFAKILEGQAPNLRVFVDEEERVVAMRAFVNQDGISVNPFLGYDRRRKGVPSLYRLITIQAFDETLAEGLLLHRSSGVASYKRSRGGRPTTEYSAVYWHHASRRQKLAWQIFSAVLNKLALPFVQHYKL